MNLIHCLAHNKRCTPAWVVYVVKNLKVDQTHVYYGHTPVMYLFAKSAIDPKVLVQIARDGCLTITSKVIDEVKKDNSELCLYVSVLNFAPSLERKSGRGSSPPSWK